MRGRGVVQEFFFDGVFVEPGDGRPQRIVGSDFDENAYWDARLGLSKPNAEVRTLSPFHPGCSGFVTV
jgi:hypothetical protein